MVMRRASGMDNESEVDNRVLEAEGSGKPSTSKPEADAATEGGLDTLDKIQVGADVVGLIPAVGNVVNGGNAIVSVGRAVHSGVTGNGRAKEHLLNAGISAVGLIPIAGNVAKGAQLAKTGAKVFTAGKCVARGTRVIKVSQAGKAAITATKSVKYAMAADTIRKGVQVGRYAVAGSKVARIATSVPSPAASTVGAKVGEHVSSGIRNGIGGDLGDKIGSKVGDAVAKKVDASAIGRKVTPDRMERLESVMRDGRKVVSRMTDSSTRRTQSRQSPAASMDAAGGPESYKPDHLLQLPSGIRPVMSSLCGRGSNPRCESKRDPDANGMPEDEAMTSTTDDWFDLRKMVSRASGRGHGDDDEAIS